MRAVVKLPPSSLRERVSCTAEIREYLVVGSRTAGAIRNFLASTGYDLSGFERILDFACGCGRTLNFIRESVASDKLHACDYDRELAAWCGRNLDVKCSVNRSDPPLDYPAGHFDLIYAISFLTHVDAPAQLSWLREWKRILRPDGVIVVSLLGERLARREGVKIPDRGYFFRGRGRKFNENVCYHSRSYIENCWGREFSLLAYSELGLNHHQDLLLLGDPDSPRRRVSRPARSPIPAELREAWRRREDLRRNFDSAGVGLPDSYWNNLSLLDWVLFDGWKEEASLRPFSFDARYEVIEAV